MLTTNIPCSAYVYQGAGSCWGIRVVLQISTNSDGTLNLSVRFEKFNQSSIFYEYVADIEDFLCGETITLQCDDQNNAPDCTFPATATLQMVEAPAITDLAASICVAPQATCIAPVSAGQSAEAGRPSQSKCPEPTTSPERCTSSCPTEEKSCCGGPRTSSGGHDVATPVVQLTRRLQEILPKIDGPALLDYSTGSLQVSVGPPSAAPLDALPLLTFNSRVTLISDFGRGVTDRYSVKVTSVDANTADLTTASGEVLRYRYKDGSGVYKPPGGVSSKLVKNGDGTWTEFQANGDKLQYTSAGVLDYLANPAGSRWTATYSSSKLSAIVAPTGRRTTYAYDGVTGKIKTIQDPAGRVTTFTVDGSNRLTQMTTPELCTTDLTYDGSNRLDAFADPLGYRTTYGYDSNGLANSVQYPTGESAGVNYVNWLSTEITDPEGNTTELTMNLGRNPTQILSPTGQLTSIVWCQNQPAAIVDALGNAISLSYETTANRTRLLHSIQMPLGGMTTLNYDGSGRLQSIVDPVSARTTYTWNGNGQRTGMTDPLGEKTLVFDSQGRIQALIDPLGNRSTWTFEATGENRTLVDPLGATTTLHYDASGHVLSEENPLGFAHDPCPRFDEPHRGHRRLTRREDDLHL